MHILDVPNLHNHLSQFLKTSLCTSNWFLSISTRPLDSTPFPVEHWLYDTSLTRCSGQLIGVLILDKSSHHSFPQIPILGQTKKLHPLLLHTSKQLAAGENQTTAHLGTLCAVSSLCWALSASWRFFSWSTHSHFSSLSVNTGPFCPPRALPQAEVQTHLYFFFFFCKIHHAAKPTIIWIPSLHQVPLESPLCSIPGPPRAPSQVLTKRKSLH